MGRGLKAYLLGPLVRLASELVFFSLPQAAFADAQWVRGAVCSEVQRWEHESDYSSPPGVAEKNARVFSFTFPVRPYSSYLFIANDGTGLVYVSGS